MGIMSIVNCKELDGRITSYGVSEKLKNIGVKQDGAVGYEVHVDHPLFDHPIKDICSAFFVEDLLEKIYGLLGDYHLSETLTITPNFSNGVMKYDVSCIIKDSHVIFVQNESLVDGVADLLIKIMEEL